MPAIDISELGKQIGLPELADASYEDIENDVVNAAIAGFADSDLMLLHPPYEGQKAELYGFTQYNQGRVARTMGKAAIENGPTPGILYDFQSYTAARLTQPRGPFEASRELGAVRIYSEAITIDENPLALPRKPTLVFDYGACLTSRSYIADQRKILERHQRPFTYLPITRSHFMNQVLLNTYDTDYGPGTAEAMVRNQLYIGQENGVGPATSEIVENQRAHKIPTEVADIILAIGARHISSESMECGIKNAHTLLKEGGMLVIRAAANPASHEVGAQKIADWAFESGFQEKNEIRYQAKLDVIRTALTTGTFGQSTLQTIVLAK